MFEHGTEMVRSVVWIFLSDLESRVLSLEFLWYGPWSGFPVQKFWDKLVQSGFFIIEKTDHEKSRPDYTDQGILDYEPDQKILTTDQVEKIRIDKAGPVRAAIAREGHSRARLIYWTE